MEINTIGLFLDYYEKIRQRTMKVIRQIPPEKIDWTYKEGKEGKEGKEDKFSFADLIRHLASIERYMYAENAQLKPSRYPGHGKELAAGYENILAYMDRMHKESMEIFSKLKDEGLQKRCKTPGEAEITVWKGPTGGKLRYPAISSPHLTGKARIASSYSPATSDKAKSR